VVAEERRKDDSTSGSKLIGKVIDRKHLVICFRSSLTGCHLP